MVYNRPYNTRNSQGRYNTPGQFVAAGPPLPPPPPPPHQQQQQQQQQQQYQQSQQEYQQSQQEYYQQPKQESYQQTQQSFGQRTNQSQGYTKNTTSHTMQNSSLNNTSGDVDMSGGADSGAVRPPWMKSKLQGVKKITKKEKRRRQNENLRRLITPKNALMVLNEMLLNNQISSNVSPQSFKVEPAEEPNQYFKSQSKNCFCAELTLEGRTYKGYGENKMVARNAAAEQAVRDMIIQRMNSADMSSEEANGDMSPSSLPMIQLASFALHKLFAEWECGGHKVPALRPLAGPSPLSQAGGADEAAPAPAAKPKPPRRPKELPANARSMHPCMVLTHMRPQLAYRDLSQGAPFSVGVDVDGATYVGTASNKKEARREAARAACLALFGLKFDAIPTARAPAPAPAAASATA